MDLRGYAGSNLATRGSRRVLVRPDARFAEAPGFARRRIAGTVVDDGLMVSATPVKVIALPTRREASAVSSGMEMPEEARTDLDWLSQPLSGRGLAWTVHALVVVAGILLFGLVFLAITGEAPRWPISMVGGATFVIAGLYWIFFQIFGGTSLGTRLARLAGYGQEEEEESGPRFR